MAPVVRKFENRTAVLVSVAEKRIRVLADFVVALAKHLHAKQTGVEIDCLVLILDPDHRVHQPKII